MSSLVDTTKLEKVKNWRKTVEHLTNYWLFNVLFIPLDLINVISLFSMNPLFSFNMFCKKYFPKNIGFNNQNNSINNSEWFIKENINKRIIISCKNGIKIPIK